MLLLLVYFLSNSFLLYSSFDERVQASSIAPRLHIMDVMLYQAFLTLLSLSLSYSSSPHVNRNTRTSLINANVEEFFYFDIEIRDSGQLDEFFVVSKKYEADLLKINPLQNLLGR